MTVKIHVLINYVETDVHEITKEKVMIGRDASNDIVIDVPTISRRHLRFIARGGRFGISDLGRKNDIYINDELLEGRKEIFDGALIELSPDVTLRLEVDEVSSEPVVSSTPADENTDSPPPEEEVTSTTEFSEDLTDDTDDGLPEITDARPTMELGKISIDDEEETSSIRELVEEKPKVNPLSARRVGCPFCFRTLTPADEDERLQSFVKVVDKTADKTKFYHEACWSQYSSTGRFNEDNYDVDTFEVQKPPPPLEVIKRLPLRSRTGGPENSMEDIPLGVSASRISISPSSDKIHTSFQLRNNSNSAITISRLQMPAWSYVDYGSYNNESDWLVLNPGDSSEVTVYPHFIRPSLGGMRLDLSERQHVILSVDHTSRMIWGPIVVLLVLAWFHISAFSNWLGTSPNAFVPLFVTSLTFGLLISWVFFLMPIRLTWLGFIIIDGLKDWKLLSSIEPVGQSIDQIHTELWGMFDSKTVAKLLQEIPILILTSLGVGVVMTVLSMPVWYLMNWLSLGLHQILSGLGTLAIWLLYVGGMFALANYLLIEYRIGLFDMVISLIQRVRS